MTELRPAVFIDKDGTLIHDVPYNVDPSLLRFRHGAPEALAALSAQGFALIVVTNQSGIAQGRFTAAAFARLQRVLQQQLRERGGVELTDFLHCPHAPDGEGRPTCACRKPQPGLLLQAARRHGIDLRRSWMVGDTLDDVEAGTRSGCRALLLDTGGETVWRRSPWRVPLRRLTEWIDVAQFILADRLLSAPGRIQV
jgi:D-glycero-D-manno-heptose 1,7-bisphosphate phosphatase